MASSQIKDLAEAVKCFALAKKGGTTVENDPDDRACRTKLAAEPIGDIEKLFTQWDQWGWHRVTVYGDLKEPVHALAEAMGWSVVTETQAQSPQMEG